MGPLKENKIKRTASKKGLMASLWGKDFKTTILKILKELKDVEKVKKTMYEQKGKSKRQNLKRNQKENSGVVQCNNWREKFTGKIQRLI